VDTGATIGYGPREAFAGLVPAGTFTDFYPLHGQFTTPVHELDVTIGGRTFKGRFGELPDGLKPITMLGFEGWIIGSDFFRDRAVLFDMKELLLADVTDSFAEVQEAA
jgi:hypothetical protein